MATPKTLRSVAITGTGMYVPDRVITNQDLEALMDTSDEWIRQRSGIQERRFADAGVATSDLALQATQNALKAAGLEPKDLDAIIFATLSPDHYFPGSSAFLQAKLGLEKIPGMDIRAQCTGFIYALDVGQMYVATGKYDRVLVVGAELHSCALDMTNRGRDVAVLFGDGAGAVILEAAKNPEHGIMSIHTHLDGKFGDRLWVQYPSSGHRPWVTADIVEQAGTFPKMDGKFVFKHAVTRMPEVIHEGLKAHNMQVADVDFFIFHQANLRINEFISQQLGVPAEKTYNNIQKYGNCSAASIPMVLDEVARQGKIKNGDVICMTAFGAGFTWGSAFIRWGA